MGVLKREEFFERIENFLQNNNSDESISFLEDMTDTYNDLERRANGDGVDWEAKYNELNENWKKRYRHRFFSSSGEGIIHDETPTEDEYIPESITIDDLFKEKEVK